MSVTPQLKDKVEFTLDNRQIFFLFFGLSVVGCFVFAMGVMVGKRGELHDLPGVAQADSVVLLDDEPALADNSFSFEKGLQTPATDGLPATRDPSVAPRDEETVRAERDAALGSKSLKKPGSNRKLPAIPAPAKPTAAKNVPPLAGAVDLALQHGIGLHLPAAMLRAQRERPVPPDQLLSASCHDAEELDLAQALGCDFAIVGSVLATPSHPGQPGIGWARFEILRARASLPLYAIGGLAPGDLAAARSHGAQGIAAIRGLWQA